MGLAARRQARSARDGRKINNKRVQRLWREEGLKVPYRKRKKPHRGDRHRGRGDVPDRTERPVGARLPVRHDRRWPHPEAVEHRRRVHPRMPGDRRRARHCDADKVVATLDRLAVERGAPGVRAVRQRPGVHRPRGRGLVPLQRCRYRLHRSRFTMAERLDREASTAGSATSSSTAGTSTTCSKPKSSSRTGASTTTPTDRTAPTATSPQPSSPRHGSPETNQHSHNRWTTQRGPLRRHS